MRVKHEAQIWAIIAFLLFVVLWFLGNALLPFILGIILAYLFNPLVGVIEKITNSRLFATILLALGITIWGFAIVLTIIPIILQQTSLLVNALPSLFENFAQFIEKTFAKYFNIDTLSVDKLSGLGNTLSDKTSAILDSLLRQASSFANLLMLIVVVPVVSIYFLIDWNNIIAHIDKLLPRKYAPKIRHIISEIDQTLASFLRGQSTVCLLLGIFYVIGLSLAGLNFAILIGIVAGILTFIPYLGAIIGAMLAIGMGCFQFWGDWGQIALIAAIFISGQFIEGNIITPKLVGKSVGLHPLWILLALSIFGKLFGFVGVLTAVPIAAVIGVLTRHIIKKYTTTTLYRGKNTNP